MIYLDNAATTKVDKQVVEAMLPYLTEKYGNASSNHKIGREAEYALDKSREDIAKSINASSEEIIFTSGGTESNNLAIIGTMRANANKGNHLIVSRIEHDSVLNICKNLEKNGFKITYLGVDSDGYIDIDGLTSSIKKETALVSIMHANNEIGTIQNIKEIGAICKENNLPLHTDACQSYTKTNVDVEKQNITLASLNSHKIHGPKGIGALYIRDGTKIKAITYGGGHEHSIRPGTENIPAIAGFAKAAELACNNMGTHAAYIEKLKKELVNGILHMYIENSSDKKLPNAMDMLNGPNNGICNIANFSFRGLQGDSIVAYLDENNICASVGSACTTQKIEPSHVLMAIGLSKAEALSSVRFSLSRLNTKEDIDAVLEILPQIIGKLRKVSPLSR